MYITKVTINGLDETATYPIVVSLSQDILHILGIGKDVPLTIGENPHLRITKNTNGKNTHIPDIYDEELFIEYVETSTEDFDVALTARDPIATAIYSDADIRTYITPIISRRTLTLSVKYYSKSKSQASKIANRLRLLNPVDKRSVYHDIDYIYYIPDVIMDLVTTFNDLKNTHTTPAISIDEYIKTNFSAAATVINSETGFVHKSNLSMQSVEQSVIGTIDTDVYNIEKDKDDSSGRWGFGMEYSIQYEMPTQLLVNYPLTIYNQPVPAKFRLTGASKAKATNTADSTYDSKALDNLTARNTDSLRISKNDYYLRMPPEDVTILPKPIVGNVRLFSIVSVVDVTNPTMLFYLDELPGMVFKPDVIKLIELEAGRIGDKFKSIFYINLYNFESEAYTYKVIVTPVQETINGVLTNRIKLTTDIPLDIKGSYRVVFNVLIDLTIMRPSALAALKNNIDIVDKQNITGFSVIDTVFSILDIDTSKVNSSLVLTPHTTSMAIALNIKNDLYHRVYTKQTSLILTGIFNKK